MIVTQLPSPVVSKQASPMRMKVVHDSVLTCSALPAVCPHCILQVQLRQDLIKLAVLEMIDVLQGPWLTLLTEVRALLLLTSVTGWDGAVWKACMLLQCNGKLHPLLCRLVC